MRLVFLALGFVAEMTCLGVGTLALAMGKPGEAAAAFALGAFLIAWETRRQVFDVEHKLRTLCNGRWFRP